MMQPDTTSGAVAKPYSSAPRRAPITTSLPVFIWPSTWTTIRSRRSLAMRVCCVSASPSSQGIPACFWEVSGVAPVPPSWPEMRTTSEWALATPAATVPTPTSATSFTCTRAGLGPLGDLDLDVIGVDQVLRGHPEAARGHLLDGAAPRVAVGVGGEPVRVLAALARVGLAAQPVHGDGQGLVGLGRDRSVGHGAGREPGHDGRHRLHPVSYTHLT